MGPQQGRLTGIVKCNLNDTMETTEKEIDGKGDVGDCIDFGSSSASFNPLADNSSNNGDYSLILDLLGDFILPSVKIDKDIFMATDISKPTLIPYQNRIVLRTQAGLLFSKEKKGKTNKKIIFILYFHCF